MIQRSFVGRSIPNIVHVATVPLEEIGSSGTDLEDILSEILAIPRASVLGESDYARIIERVRGLPPEYFWPAFWWRHQVVSSGYYERIFGARSDEPDGHRFLGDFVSLISSPVSAPSPTSIFNSVLIEEEGNLPSSEMSEDALQLALSCLSSRLARRPQVEAFYKELLSYDIPVGQSPRARGDSLLTLLETSRKFCVAPLALGATPAISQLSQGNYVGALLTTGTAAIMTLVLIGTVSIGSLMVQRVAQVRSKRSTRSLESGASETYAE